DSASSAASSFSVASPDSISYSNPTDKNTNSCDFTDQNAIDNDIANWVNSQTATINNNLTGGCSPNVTNDFESQSIDMCTGGSLTINWTIKDNCTESTVAATYTLTKPAGINHYFPDPVTVSACDFENQEDFDTKFAEWVDAEIIKMDDSYEGGCAPFTTHNFTNQTIDICTGGEIVITWLTNDKCEVDHTHTTTYTLTAPPVITYNAPSND
ncbi:hypothetical protein, partial [Mariniflexile sp. HMF6888]|uniref:hypothetical protein n=1 Tax=Mariniflexile sp. HMF6888 TaxID=3373086 RepID=UPI0037BCF4CE